MRLFGRHIKAILGVTDKTNCRVLTNRQLPSLEVWEHNSKLEQTKLKKIQIRSKNLYTHSTLPNISYGCLSLWRMRVSASPDLTFEFRMIKNDQNSNDKPLICSASAGCAILWLGLCFSYKRRPNKSYRLITLTMLFVIVDSHFIYGRSEYMPFVCQHQRSCWR